MSGPRDDGGEGGGERASTGVPDAPMSGGPSDPLPPRGRPPGTTQPIPPPTETGGAAGGGGDPPRRKRPTTLFGDSGGPVQRWLSRWGFPLFILVIVILGRNVLLPFIFAGLIAYILAPVVRWMSERKDGTRRMPRGLAIIICYIVFLAALVGFGFILVPRLAKDVSRLGREAPAVYKKVNEEYVPELAQYLEEKFPQLKPKPQEVEQEVVVPDVPLPPNTAATLTPLPDGRFAIQLSPSGIELQPQKDGSYRVLPTEAPPTQETTEEKLRAFVEKAMASLQDQVDDVVRFGQRLIAGVLRGIYTFFLVLMIGGFMLIDLEKVHSFLRSLFPPHVRDDYDVIMEGIDRGLSGVIRGQLLICLINGILTYIGLLIFGVKYSLILAVVAGLMSLIPIFGSILSTIPIVLAALLSGDEGLDVIRAILSVLWIIGIHFIEANFLNPKIIGSSAKIHPVVVIFALVLGERTYGLVGALLAVPVASMIQVLFVFFYKKAWKKDPGVTGPHPVQ
jgi:predicted PurR-regulated permease PerM